MATTYQFFDMELYVLRNALKRYIHYGYGDDGEKLIAMELLKRFPAVAVLEDHKVGIKTVKTRLTGPGEAPTRRRDHS